MKKLLFLALIAFFASCTGVRTASTGLENDSYLIFIGNPNNYVGGVSVTVDDNAPFFAEVQKDHAKRPKGSIYAISTGTHVVAVSYKNALLFKKQIFVGAQETKKIILP